MSKMVTSDLTNMVEHDAITLMWYISLIHLLSFAPQSTGLRLSGLYLTTRNMLLLTQQISGAQAEAIPQPPMKQGEMRAPRSVWKWATVTFKWESEKKGEKRWGAAGGERGKRQCVCHNKLLSMTKQHWLASSTAPDTRVSLCVCVCVHPTVRDPKLTSKYGPPVFNYVTFSLVITKSLMQDVNAESCALI